ncbi:MAG TPA: YCF48-related protein, partial [Ignavibacteria bacterium]|nr:YCF48-related protein [Ignavibacteria bacterium]
MFTSEQNAFALSADGKSLFRSVSGGATWDPVFNVGVALNDVSFRNDNEGYAIMHNQYINYSNNSGASWQIVYTSPNNLRQVYSLNARSNYVTGNETSGLSFLLRTIDSGNTWQRFNIGQGSPEYIKMISESNGWVIMTSPDGINTVIYKTNNGGAEWYNINAPMGGCFYSAYALDENNLWIVLYDCENFKYYFYKTNNGGLSFVQMPNNYIIQNVYFVDQNNGFAIGDYNLLLSTTTGGYTWVPQTGNSENKMLSSVGFYNRTTGVITGSNGSVYKYTNITDTSAFSMSGNITNPVLQGIIKTDNTPRYAIGTFAKSYPNILAFHINRYSGGAGDVNDGGGT